MFLFYHNFLGKLSVLHRNLQVKYVISHNKKRYVATGLHNSFDLLVVVSEL